MEPRRISLSLLQGLEKMGWSRHLPDVRNRYWNSLIYKNQQRAPELCLIGDALHSVVGVLGA